MPERAIQKSPYYDSEGFLFQPLKTVKLNELNHRTTVTQQSKEDLFKPLTDKENLLAKEVIDIAFKLHMNLGPGLLESVYARCFYYELQQREIPFVRQQLVPIKYEGMFIEDGLRLDILVDDLLIIELKAQENFHPVWEAQLLSYLRLTGKRIGYIINFHVPLMKNGFKRYIL